MTRSAPYFIGRCSAGEQKQLSTASQAPAVLRDRRQRADVADLGQRIGRRFGEQQLRVRLDRAAPFARRRSARRSVVSTPNFANSRPSSMIVEPNTLCEQMTWSPAFSRPMPSSRIALMPLDVRDAGFGAFERGEAALEHRHRRVGEARIDEGFFLVGEARRGRSRRRAARSCWSGTAPRSSRPMRSAAGLRAPRACRAARRPAGRTRGICLSPCHQLTSVALCSARRERLVGVFVLALRRRAAPPSRRSRRRVTSPVM